MKSNQFGNIFFGTRPYHKEKIVIACLEKFFAFSDVDLTLIETEAFDMLVVENSVKEWKLLLQKQGNNESCIRDDGRSYV